MTHGTDNEVRNVSSLGCHDRMRCQWQGQLYLLLRNTTLRVNSLSVTKDYIHAFSILYLIPFRFYLQVCNELDVLVYE